jgi:hypothetical protein
MGGMREGRKFRCCSRSVVHQGGSWEVLAMWAARLGHILAGDSRVVHFVRTLLRMCSMGNAAHYP